MPQCWWHVVPRVIDINKWHLSSIQHQINSSHGCNPNTIRSQRFALVFELAMTKLLLAQLGAQTECICAIFIYLCFRTWNLSLMGTDPLCFLCRGLWFLGSKRQHHYKMGRYALDSWWICCKYHSRTDSCRMSSIIFKFNLAIIGWSDLLNIGRFDSHTIQIVQ